MTARIFRYEVPVDDHWHSIDLQSDVLSVGCRQVDVVEFWAWNFDSYPNEFVRYEFCVFGTGHPVPEGADYVDTAVAPGGQLVWHLVRRSAS